MAIPMFTMAAVGLAYKTKSDKMEQHYYNIDVNWNSERKGVMCSPSKMEKLNGGNQELYQQITFNKLSINIQTK